MPKLGKSLGFYLKYQAEMNRLYWIPRETGEKPKLDGLKDKEKVLTMAQRVGDAACREAAVFLEACADLIEPLLQAVAITHRVRRSLEQSWSVLWRLSPKKQPDRSIYVGVYIDDEIHAVVPWIWSRGGRRAEDQIARILDRGGKTRVVRELQLGPGNVALARINVRVPESLHDFDVDQEQIVKEVCKALTFDAADVKALAGIASKTSD